MILDQLTEWKGFVLGRKTWMDKPDLPEDYYNYCPHYGLSGMLLWNYEESDKSFRERILNKRLGEE